MTNFQMQQKKEILKRLKNSLVSDKSAIEGTFNSDILSANAIEFEQAYAELALAMEANFATTSWGQYLTARAAEFGVVRKEATKAIAYLTVKGEAGAQIIIGSLFATPDDIRFYSLEDAFIDATGQVIIKVECGEAGTVGNVPEESIINIPMSIPKITSCINLEPAFDGFTTEQDLQLLERYLLKVRLPATSGNEYHYLQWALGIEGVGQAKVLPLWNGNGTVKVIIINSDNQTASEEIIQKVADYIESVRPIGATVTVSSPDPKLINITADVQGTPDIDAIKTAIDTYFKNDGFRLTSVSIAHIGKVLLEVGGIDDYFDLQLNDGAMNIPLSDDELPACGEVVLNVL